MAGEGDLKQMLMMFTARKVPMMSAMGHIKNLQAKGLKSIDDIAKSPLTSIEEALGDAKLAKSFYAACKSHGNATKRPADDAASPGSAPKKPRLQPHRYDLDYSSMAADDLEAALDLPFAEDEAVIRATRLVTNRAPLVLAFAVELLRFTMPEQPPSSRLSLAQAVVSANSRSKAISIGLEKAPSGGDVIPDNQPKVRVMGREIPVLKRGGYTWSGATEDASTQSTATLSQPSQPRSQSGTATGSDNMWATSQKLASRSSTFVAHAAAVSSASRRGEMVKTLMSQKPELETATHNAWAMRSRYGGSPLVQEASFDDGESGCGRFLLQVMREADVADTVVVLTRWYGGIMLGPDRWRLMRECVSDALAAQRRTTSALSGSDAVWGLDAEDKKPTVSTVGMAIHRPEGARNYLLRSFATAEKTTASLDGAAEAEGQENDKDKTKGKKTTTVAAANEEKQENLGRLLGALRLLFNSWAGVLRRDELDRRAWGWYVAVRPDVEAGPLGWGAKGTLDLGRILDLRRKGT